MQLEENFNEHVNRMRSKETPTSDQDLLILYGLYKQVTIGNCNIVQPWTVQTEQYARWKAWYGIYGMNRDMAMRKYIEKVDELTRETFQ